MIANYFSSEYRFVEYCIALSQARIARYATLLETAKLTKRQRAKIELWREHERHWLSANQTERDVMLTENFDVVRRTAMSEYEIVALDPAKPILRDMVTLVRHNWSAYRTETNARQHGIRGWYETGARTQTITTTRACES